MQVFTTPSRIAGLTFADSSSTAYEGSGTDEWKLSAIDEDNTKIVLILL